MSTLVNLNRAQRACIDQLRHVSGRGSVNVRVEGSVGPHDDLTSGLVTGLGVEVKISSFVSRPGRQCPRCLRTEGGTFHQIELTWRNGEFTRAKVDRESFTTLGRAMRTYLVRAET